MTNLSLDTNEARETFAALTSLLLGHNILQFYYFSLTLYMQRLSFVTDIYNKNVFIIMMLTFLYAAQMMSLC